VTIRAISCPPELLPANNGPPTGLHRLAFTHARPLTEDELRRLSLSADLHRSLIGV
jgi:sensor domain DACNV-containing protein